MRAWVTLLLVSAVTCVAQAKHGFLLTAPAELHIGHTERLCISFHGWEAGASELFRFSVSLMHRNESQHTQSYTVRTFDDCVDFDVPSTLKDRTMSLHVQGRARNVEYVFERHKHVHVRHLSLTTFIQTDKPIYKPGQTVKLRVLSMNEKMIPQLTPFKKITIIDQEDIKIMQWQNVSVTETQGIADLELPLSEEPTLGRWTVKVQLHGTNQEEVGYFKVEEYVLPKYEISVNMPSYVTVIDEKVRGEICAMYTYGEPVRGVLNARFCIVLRGWRRNEPARPCYYMNNTQITGCHEFDVLTSDLELTNGNYSIYSTELEVFAQITETATGVVLNKTHSDVQVTKDIFDMEFLESSPDYFKPGLPYYGRLRVKKPDGSAAVGEKVTIEFHEYTHNKHFSKISTTDSHGLVSFSLPPIKIEITSLSLEAKMPDYIYKYKRNRHVPNEVRANKYLKQWYSPSNSYVQVKPIEDAVACDSHVNLTISHTAAEQGFVDLHYQVISRGNILEAGMVRHSFQDEGEFTEADATFEEINCPPGQVVSTCVPRNTTCDNVDEPIPYDWGWDMPRGTRCKRGCMCPWPTNVYHEGSCITEMECPDYNGTFVPTECPPGQGFYDCGSACDQTCESPESMLCTMQCVPRCQCPPRTPIYHEGECIARRDCPQNRDDRSKINPIVYFNHMVHVSAEMSPLVKILVYYVREDGETIADSVEVDVQACTRNKVEIEFMDEELYPGDMTKLRIKADPESLCSVGVVDKSVHIMGGQNTLTLNQAIREIEQYTLDSSSLAEDENEYCRKQLLAEEKRRNRSPVPRWRRSIMWPGQFTSDYFDSMRAFRFSGVVTITDNVIFTRPCRTHCIVREDGKGFICPMAMISERGEVAVDMEVAVDSPPDSAVKAKKSLDLRTYFPETWLWDLHLVGRSGEKEVIKELPHTVTSWVGGGFCTNLETGLGVSDTTSIKAFQPFFVSLTLPYSLIRHEVINLPVTVFNYLSQCLNVELTIKESAELDMAGERTKRACVCGQETTTQYFRFSPNTLGKVNVTITANSLEDTGLCGEENFATDYAGVRDAVVRTLLVEAEGQPQTYSKTSFICPETDVMYQEEMKLDMPDNVVEDTAKAMVKVIGDLMGPALEDIDSLLAMPTGCGEQNMLKFAPNIFVMQYLQAVDEVTPEIKTKSMEFLRTGYQRELNYRHTDGSYSAFGNSDDSGSMWLTAFVVKSFAQASPLMFIDEEDLDMSITWILDAQMENGCFPKIGRVLHKDMKGGLEADDASADTLTAYVLISLLEAAEYVPIRKSAIEEAFNCLEMHDSSDVYTLALKAYAYSLYDVTGDARARVMDLIEAQAQSDGDRKYWTTGTSSNNEDHYGDNNAKSVDIEVTSYMLLAYTVPDAEGAVNNGLPLVFWLTKQRSAGGGFSSTQDTVIALQALARYQALAYSESMDLRVMVSDDSTMLFEFSVDNSNKMIMQKHAVQMPNQLMVEVMGTGCAFVQTAVHYNMLEIPVEEPAFSLTAHARQVSSTDGCKRRELRVCARYLLDDEVSNMAVISVKMVSGWIPDKDTIKNLMNSVELPNLKRFEIEPNSVNFYFDEITKYEVCVTFQVEQNVEVEDAEPSYAVVYDYYEKEKRISVAYEIRDVCGTKEELPHLTEQEYNDILDRDNEDPSTIEQRRQPIVHPKNLDPIGDLASALDRELGEPVIEEPIVPEVAFPLGQGDSGPPSTLECPLCFDTVPDSFPFHLCQSKYAYKTVIRSGRYQAKVMADLRPRRKHVIETFANFNMPDGCTCITLSLPRNSKIMVLQGDDGQFDSTQTEIRLTSSSRVIPYPKNAGLVSRAAILECE